MNVILKHNYKKNIAFPTYEPKTTKWVLNNAKEDWVYLDCGANIGYYTIIFSKLSPKGTIHAFEPTDTMVMLKKNCELNGCENIIYHDEALGNKDGVFVEPVYKIWGKPPETKKYKFRTLDTFQKLNNLPRIDLIKIDVDSFDYEVAEGAEQLLKASSPLVLIELNRALKLRNKKPKDVVELMKGFGYKNTQVLDENFLFEKE